MDNKRTYEQAMTELEAVVRQLESNEISLDDSLKAFERGVALTRECELFLNEAKGKVEKLVSDLDGAIKAERFEVKE